MNTLLCAFLGYLLGSISFAVIVSWAFGLDDPRQHGSGNPGATNVLRTGSKPAALLTLLGDGLKGWFAIWLAGQLGANSYGVALAGVFAFLGHVFPVFLRFRGGKGVATAMGVLIGLSGTLALVSVSAWLITVLASRYSSLAALAAALVAPVAAGILVGRIEVITAVMLMSGVLIWRHRDNIRRLFNRTESRIGASSNSTSR